MFSAFFSFSLYVFQRFCFFPFASRPLLPPPSPFHATAPFYPLPDTRKYILTLTILYPSPGVANLKLRARQIILVVFVLLNSTLLSFLFFF